MCENKCCYVQTENCKDSCCSGVVTTNTGNKEYEYVVVPNYQGEPMIVSSQNPCVDQTLAYGINTKVLLNGKFFPHILEFNFSEEEKKGYICGILGTHVEDFTNQSELKIVTTIGEKEITLYDEVINILDKEYTITLDKNFIKVTIYFEKFKL